MTLRDKTGKKITLAPVRPNAGIRAAYRKRLLALVDEMHRSYDRWITASYRKNEPAIIVAMDATPAKELDKELKRLAKYWGKRFDDAADELAAYFAKSASRRSDRALQSILKRGGWTVKLKMTRAMRDVIAATVAENVGLIKSIPERYHADVQGLVMRSVTAGRDLSKLSDDLEKRYRVSQRQAELIARDQNNKATATFQRARYIELGVKEAIWLHSAGGKKPRPTHVKNSGKRYNVAEGWYDPAVKRHILPGELINCRCVSRPVVKGFS
jgi:SPP1 gp7 family putative phage head morphogenesis protein